MKNLIILFAALFSLNSANAQGKNITLVKSIETQNQQQLNLDLPGDLVVQYWAKDYIRIELEVKSNINSRGTLKHLCSMGRFSPTIQNTEAAMNISMDGLNQKVVINNQPVKNELSYKIFIPLGMTLSKTDVYTDLLTSVN